MTVFVVPRLLTNFFIRCDLRWGILYRYGWISCSDVIFNGYLVRKHKAACPPLTTTQRIRSSTQLYNLFIVFVVILSDPCKCLSLFVITCWKTLISLCGELFGIIHEGLQYVTNDLCNVLTTISMVGLGRMPSRSSNLFNVSPRIV